MKPFLLFAYFSFVSLHGLAQKQKWHSTIDTLEHLPDKVLVEFKSYENSKLYEQAQGFLFLIV